MQRNDCFSSTDGFTIVPSSETRGGISVHRNYDGSEKDRVLFQKSLYKRSKE